MTNDNRPAETQPWMLFAFPAAIVVPIIGGFMLGGPIVGFLVAPLVALVVVGVAIGMAPQSSRDAAVDSRDDAAERRDRRRAATRRFLVPVAIAALGIVLIATTSETVSIVGWGTFAVAVTVAISLIFLEIGYSEDRARAREDRVRRRPRRSAG